eukprot:ANDGO_06817.mRNA.1 ATP-dependent DNA helicase Q-like 1
MIVSIQLNGSSSSLDIESAVASAVAGNVKLIYMTPEFVSGKRGLGVLQSLHAHAALGAFAIDEAHCISSWGNDFRPKYRTLCIVRDQFPLIPILAVTATATKAVQKDILQTLKLSNAYCIQTSFNRPEIVYKVVSKDEEYLQQIVDYVLEHFDLGLECGVIYCRTKKDCGEIASLLGSRAAAYTSSIPAATRVATSERFLRGELRVICATVAFGMGIDKCDVRFVVHATVPASMEAFYQESGRAGRDGKRSQSIVFFSKSDIETLVYLSRQEQSSKLLTLLAEACGDDVQNDSIGSQPPAELSVELYRRKLDGKTLNRIEKIVEEQAEHSLRAIQCMLDYSTCSTCRRKLILQYFGDAAPAPTAECCDVCSSLSRKRNRPQDGLGKPLEDPLDTSMEQKQHSKRPSSFMSAKNFQSALRDSSNNTISSYFKRK